LKVIVSDLLPSDADLTLKEKLDGLVTSGRTGLAARVMRMGDGIANFR
jgi:hypothetical protein